MESRRVQKAVVSCRVGWRDRGGGDDKSRREVSCLVVGDAVARKLGGLFDGLSK